MAKPLNDTFLLKRLHASYDDFVSEAKTGDIILMHGTWNSSYFVQFLQQCKWSHSAMIVRGSDVGIEVEGDPLLLWESNLLTPVVDVILNKPKKSGPMLVRLQERIAYNFKADDDTMFGVRHLNAERDQHFYDGIANAIKSTHGAIFPTPHYKEFTHAIEGRLARKKSTDGSFFCSQLVAHTFKQAGLLADTHPDNAYVPADFSTSIDIALRRRAFLGPENELDTRSIRMALARSGLLSYDEPPEVEISFTFPKTA